METNCYFTISEFGKLRNVNINSLRYYEKIGILKPDYVDKKTGYRYYSPNQLPILDVILLCLDFGMPLKELKSYNCGRFFCPNHKLIHTLYHEKSPNDLKIIEAFIKLILNY